MSNIQPNGGLKSGSPKLQHSQAELNEEPCILHKDKVLQLFCKTCNQLVCTNCIVENHSQHSFQGIQEVAIEGRNRMQQLIKTAKEKHLVEIIAQLKKLESMKRDCIVQTDKIIEEFKSRQSHLCQEVEVATLKHISAVQVRRQKDKQEIQAIEKNVLEKKSTSDTLLNTCNYLIHEGSDVAVIRSKESVDNLAKLLEKRIEICEIKPPKVIFMNIEEDAIENLLGNFEIGEKENTLKAAQASKADKKEEEIIQEADFAVERIYSFDCQGKGGVLAIQPVYEDSALVTCYDSANKIHNIGVNVDKTKYSLSFPINDLAVTRSGDVLVSSYHSRCIKKLYPDGKVDNFISTSMLLPLGIHVNRNGDILACLVDELNYVIEPNSRRQVIKFSKIGKALDVFEYNGYRRLFTLPGSVSQNTNEDICVVDLLSENSGGIMILDKHGHQKSLYSGPGEGHTFRPHSVCNDNQGHIIVSDLSNSSIHILNEKGFFMCILLSSGEGLYRPSAICIDRHGYLWVGHAKKSESESVIVEEAIVQVFKYIK